MKTKKTVAALALFTALSLTGCVMPHRAAQIPVDWNDPATVAQRITAIHDNFKKHTKYEGPNIGSYGDILMIRAWQLDDTGTTNYQIYVADYYDAEWRFYNSAYDNKGTKLDVTLISRDIGYCSKYSGCSHTEHVGVNVTRPYLEKNLAEGIYLQLSGKTGEEIFFIPGGYIKAMLDATLPKGIKS